MRMALHQVVHKLVGNPGTSLFNAPVFFWDAQVESLAENWEPTMTAMAVARKNSGPSFLVLEKKTHKPNPAVGITLGRADTNDIVIDEISVSRFHAWILRDLDADQWLLRDGDSSFGTFVNDQRLDIKDRVPLLDRSNVRIGKIDLTFMLPATAEMFIRDTWSRK